MGVLSAVVSLSVVLQLLSPLFEKRYGRKYSWYVFAGASRLAFLPFLFLPEVALLPIVIIAIQFLAVALRNLGIPSWFSWVYDIVPERRAGIFWARRQRGIALLSVVVMVCLGFCMESVEQEHKLMLVKSVFALAIIVGIMGVLLHVGIPEPPQKRIKEAKFFQELLFPLQNKNFRNWALAISFWTFSVNISGPFSIPYMLKDLGLDNFLLNTLLIIVVPAIGSVLFLSSWGRLADKFGPRPVILIGHSGWAIVPLFYILANSGNTLLMMLLVWFIVGVFTSGLRAAWPKVDIRLTQGYRRSVFMAVGIVAAAIAGAAGSLAGTWIVSCFGISQCFPVSLVCRVVSIIPFIFVTPKNSKEPGSS